MEISMQELREILNADTYEHYESGDWIGRYVIVRCRDAGVHAGELISYSGRTCELRQARRLWYWKPQSGAFLSAVATTGLSEESNIGEPDVDRP